MIPLADFQPLPVAKTNIFFINNRGFTPGGVLPQILDRGVPRRFLNPNPI